MIIPVERSRPAVLSEADLNDVVETIDVHRNQHFKSVQFQVSACRNDVQVCLYCV